MNYQIEEHKIKLAGAMNVRDLGGYPTLDGRYTKKGVYYRSDSLHNLKKEDIEKLKSLGVTLQVDLRSLQEVNKNPSKLVKIQGIDYYNTSLLDHIQSSNFEELPTDMTTLYMELLDKNHEKIAAIFRTLLSSKGIGIFNCTAGKDRTGVIAMLLLDLALVDEEIIVADYAVSAANLSEFIKAQKAQSLNHGQELPNYIFLSNPEDMKTTIWYLKSNYKDAAGYLATCGITVEEIEELRKRLIV
ncbi:MAG: tyrosine-protein phosphatase [Clostridiales bacterium]|nr:tyrosine-protein phosphatase [Clostridiales bacterium]